MASSRKEKSGELQERSLANDTSIPNGYVIKRKRGRPPKKKLKSPNIPESQHEKKDIKFRCEKPTRDFPISPSHSPQSATKRRRGCPKGGWPKHKKKKQGSIVLESMDGTDISSRTTKYNNDNDRKPSDINGATFENTGGMEFKSNVTAKNKVEDDISSRNNLKEIVTTSATCAGGISIEKDAQISTTDAKNSSPKSKIEEDVLNTGIEDISLRENIEEAVNNTIIEVIPLGNKVKEEDATVHSK